MAILSLLSVLNQQSFSKYIFSMYYVSIVDIRLGISKQLYLHSTNDSGKLEFSMRWAFGLPSPPPLLFFSFCTRNQSQPHSYQAGAVPLGYIPA